MPEEHNISHENHVSREPAGLFEKGFRQMTAMPTYIGSTLVGMGLTNGNLIGIIAMVLPFAIIYHLIYDATIVNGVWQRYKLRAFTLIVCQLLIWPAVLYLLFGNGKDM